MIGQLAYCCVSEGIVDKVWHVVIFLINSELGSVGFLHSSGVLVVADDGLVHLIGLGGLAEAVLLGWRMLFLVVGSHKGLLRQHFLRLDHIV